MNTMSDSKMPDMNALLAQAQEMGSKLMAQQEEAQATEIEGSAGAGAVKVLMSGGGQFRSVSIDPSIVDADDVETLEDLVLAALNDAVGQAGELVDTPDLGGFDLSKLGSMFGG